MRVIQEKPNDGMLIILINEGCELRDTEFIGSMEPYVSIKLLEANQINKDKHDEKNQVREWKGAPIPGGGKNPQF